MTLLTLSIILITVSLSGVAQLSLKLGVSTNSCKNNSKWISNGNNTSHTLSPPYTWAGLFIYGLNVAVWLWVLTSTDLSVTYPFFVQNSLSLSW